MTHAPSELKIERVPMPEWVTRIHYRLPDQDLGGQQEWHFATPWVFQALASPSTFRPILASPTERDPHEHRRAYWTTALYLMLYRLGWSDPAAGLNWWQRAGYPVDDPTLQLISAVWLEDGRLPILKAWLHQQARPFRDEFEQRCGYVPSIRMGNRWDESDLLALDPLGPDDLHLQKGGGRSHLTAAFGDLPGASSMLPPRHPSVRLLRSENFEHRAVLATDSMVGWYGALIDHGARLPDIGERSWQVDVFVEPVGFLGRYRRSRVTGIWFTGKHSVHTAGV